MGKPQQNQQGQEDRGQKQQDQNSETRPQETQEDQLVGPQGDLSPSPGQEDKQQDRKGQQQR